MHSTSRPRSCSRLTSTRTGTPPWITPPPAPPSATRSATVSMTSERLKDWGPKSDAAHCEAAGARLVAQFDAYRPFPDVAVNGKQTLSENIADVAGLSVAYDAWRGPLAGKPAPGAARSSAAQHGVTSFS